MTPRLVRLPLIATRRSEHPRLGRQASRLRGSGLAFDQLREYQSGDEARHLNWRATARRGDGTLIINTYFEEKETMVLLLVDLSASMDFGSGAMTKKRLAATLCASLTYSALVQQGRVGFVGFTTHVVQALPPRQAWPYLRLIPEAILSSGTPRARADFPVAVEYVCERFRRPTLLFLLSDFLDADLPGLHQALARLQQRHEVFALGLYDPREVTWPRAAARLVVRDLETGRLATYRFSRRAPPPLARRMAGHQADVQRLCQHLGIPFAALTPQCDYAEALRGLLLAPRRRGSG
ncbi:MAG: DUF58 domain-containing protein [Candidatus Tectimicrobiota bacterium]|nr:MAG: DUF58 domain-containing protein [Candidatus Tectomicrobia bacterium]